MPKKKYMTHMPGKKKTSLREQVFGATLLVVVAIMPIVVRLTHVRGAPELVALLGQEVWNDFFSFYKAWVLGLAAIVIAFYVGSDWLIGGFSKNKFIEQLKSPPIAAACVYLFMVLVSTIFSSYRHTAWLGSAERFEGMLVIFAYFIIFFAAIDFVREAKHAKLLMYGLAFSSIIMGLIGLSQFMGHNFFTTGLGAWLVMGDWNIRPDAIFDIANGSLYNPNTFSKYSAMVAPIMLACALVYDGRKWIRAVFWIATVLMLAGIMGSSNMGGLIGITVAAMVTIITFVCRFVYQIRLRKKEDEDMPAKRLNMSTWLICGAVLAALIAGLFFVPMVNQRLDFMMGRLQHAIRREALPTYNYIFEGDKLTVYWQDDEKFSLVMLDETYGPDNVLWHIYDASGQPLPLISRVLPTAPEGEPVPTSPITFTYYIPGHGNLNILKGDEHIFFPIHGSREFEIREELIIMVHTIGLFLHEGRIHSVSRNRHIIDLEIPVPAIGFYGNETWGSNRGHIWSRTFPHMPARTIIGSGPDTYTFVFPQDDVIGKQRFHSFAYIPIDKAHNMYLQTWITTGGISVFALIFLFAYYLFTSFMSIVRSRMKEGVFVFALRFGLLAGITAFCVGVMSTDSTVGSTGVFYLLLGVGYGLNYLVERVYATDEASLKS